MTGTTNGAQEPPSSGASSLPRFVADEDFNYDIVEGLRRAQPAIDILTAPEAETLHFSDPDLLAWATMHDRIVLSHDKRTLPDHFYRFLAQLGPDEHCPGVLLLPQDLGIGTCINAVLEVWELSVHTEWRDLLIRLPL